MAIHGATARLPQLLGTFAEKLQSLLKSTAKALDCHAATLYTLEDNCKTLKVRSVWGVPEERLLAPSRNLRDALGDAEGLLGQAVIADEPFLVEEWQVPEPFPVAVCVPIASISATLGTLWVFSNDEAREFQERDCQILELAAGRIALELTIRRDKAKNAAA